ncbi:non-ribosomal peptide synthetase, partial [Archangium sp.]|uniref:non-ribosomal peptide synthetase n=1 Tax=Archangium sp. TaxID=1872627 RepID=UPI00389B221B
MSDLLDRIAQLPPEKRALLEKRLKESQPPGGGVPSRAIPRRPAGLDPLPLSHSEQRMWLHEQLSPGQALYTSLTALRIEGPLSIPELEDSLYALVQRHEVLRTVFATVRGGPVRRVLPLATPGFSLEELGALTDAEQEARISEFVRAEEHTPFMLETGPLLRARLLVLGGSRFILLLAAHHIATDAWSNGILLKELAALYRARVQGREPELLPLELQAGDFACWQREAAQEAALEPHLQYWKQRLSPPPPALHLPTDRPRQASTTYAGAHLPFAFSPTLSHALRAQAQREGATVFMALIAAFQGLLHRYTGQEDFAIGTPMTYRENLQLESVVGCFINTLVLRADLSGEPSFTELLARTRKTMLEAFAHQRAPFERVVQVVNPERGPGHSPLFQVLISLEESPAALQFDQVQVQVFQTEVSVAKFELSLRLVDRPSGICGLLEYSTELFERSTIERMVEHLQAFLEGAVAAPSTPVSRLAMLPERERHQVLEAWNATRADVPWECLHVLFEQQAARTPEAMAVVSGGRGLTYAQLNARANQLAHRLGRLGVGPERRVGLCLSRSTEAIVALLGVLKAGGAYVPLEPEHPPKRLEYQLAECQAPVLLTQEKLLPRLPEGPWTILCVDRDAATLEGESTQNPRVEGLLPSHPVYIIYTSGSTGRPKGVVIEHRNLVNYTWAILRKLGQPPAGLRFATVSTLGADLGNTSIFPSLVSGGTLHVLDYDTATDPALFSRYNQEWRL